VPLLIADEIATGFGRTGAMFAYRGLDLQPDIVCLGKGLTGGVLALSAVLVAQRIYDAFLGDRDAGRHFLHGHSFAGNPIACAAALASLDLFATERTLEHVAELDAALDGILAPLRAHPRVSAVRRAGLMAGIDVVPDAWRVAGEMYARGMFTRPIGATIQLVPPLCSQTGELEAFAGALTAALEAVA